MRKKSGMTLVEVIIALAVLTIAFGAIYSLYSSSSKSYVDTELKSKLQYEVQAIQERIYTLGVQSIGIVDVNPISGGEINSITFELPLDKDTNKKMRYCFSKNGNELKLKETELYYSNNTDGSITEVSTVKLDKILSDNVKLFKIDVIDSEGADITDIKSIKVTLELMGEKGYSKKDLTGSTIITFRNYGIETNTP